nr:type IIL restriction-modification enzyme MmeI [Propionimicrobium lymphophilum]
MLDYVACWYKKAADYMQGTHIRAALVSTNSICQGQQVTPLWRPLFDQGIRFNFAHRSFVWGNEAEDQAHVHVVIIGFSYDDVTPKYLLAYPKGEEEIRRQVSHINGYLAEAPDVFVDKQMKPISDVPYMAKGFQPTDGQNLLLTSEQKDELLAKEPQAEKWVRPFSMGAEFIKGVDRYCLWLPEITGADLKRLPEVRKHVDTCREWRLQQTPIGDAYKLADRPHLLRPCGKFKDGTYIGFPKVSSELADTYQSGSSKMA